MELKRSIDEDTITQAVIASHAQARDARLREAMTCLVQHLHAFAREVKLTEAEWAAGLDYLAEVVRTDDAEVAERGELALLSDTLGLSMLVTVLNDRKPRGCTESTLPEGWSPHSSEVNESQAIAGTTTTGPACWLVATVRSADGIAIEGASVRAWASQDPRSAQRAVTDSYGRAVLRTPAPEPYPVPHDGPVGRLLEQLGRHPWRPAHLHVHIEAAGHESLGTHLFREGSRYLDGDAVFGVRRSLVVPWSRHPGGPTPDGGIADRPYERVEFDFVLAPATRRTARPKARAARA